MTFLLGDVLTFERIDWFFDIIKNVETFLSNSEVKIQIFLTGDAIYNIFNEYNIPLWKSLLTDSKVIIIIDPTESNLYGLNMHQLEEIYPLNISNFSSKIVNTDTFISENSDSESLIFNFWDKLINSIKDYGFHQKLGILSFEGPYMHRTSIHILRLIERVLNNDMNAELYAYLDALHLGHSHQKPSAFENVGDTLNRITKLSIEKNLEFLMLACSRCGMARGYIKEENTQEFVQSEDTIPSFLICNLNKIIDKFEENHVILTPFSGVIFNNFSQEDANGAISPSMSISPPIIIFMTHSPYGTEWTFGGLSFAIACANHGILTDVVFIEDGVYSLTGTHVLQEQEKIFNILEVIDATSDLECLKYYAYEPSLRKRNVYITNKIENLVIINNKNLTNLLYPINDHSKFMQRRILFF